MSEPREWTFDEICESQDFAHREVFVKKSAYEKLATELANLRKAYGMRMDDHAALQNECQAERERADKATAWLEMIARERDQARAEIERLKRLNRGAYDLNVLIEQERDLYRETLGSFKRECEALRGQLKAIAKGNMDLASIRRTKADAERVEREKLGRQ